MSMAEAPADFASRPGAGDRFHAWRARFGRTPRSLAFTPEPLQTGNGDRARRLAAGYLGFRGMEVEGQNPWAITPPGREWAEALHGFDWLDDCAVAPDEESRKRLLSWLFDWISLYGKGGPGWRAEIIGRRLSAWLAHAPFILEHASPRESRAFRRSLARQTRFLRRRWQGAPEGPGRFRALSGLIQASLALGDQSALRKDLATLAEECRRAIGGDGGLHSRNPEDLVEVLSTLAALAQSLEAEGITAPYRESLIRLAAGLRALRFGDGALARFHGGGAGDVERIDRALAASGIRASAPVEEVMGFHRLASAGTVLIFNSGGEAGSAAKGGHESRFCIEAGIRKQPLITSCGPGARFGPEWQDAARRMAAHSGLTLDDDDAPGAPGHISAIRQEDETGLWLIAEHEGWRESHGLIHQRRLFLSADGSEIRGRDLLTASGPGPRAAFDAVAKDRRIPFTLRFHLHPDVEVESFLAGSALRLRPGDGDLWIMRQSGGALKLEESVFLDEARATPRATKQIVVRARAKDYRGEVKWTFRRADAASGAD